MTLPTSHWYFSRFIDILIVCSFVLSIYSHKGLAQSFSLTLNNPQDTLKNELIKKSTQKHYPPWSSPLAPFNDTFLSSINNFTSQQKNFPLTELLILYPDLRKEILKEYMRSQLRNIDSVMVFHRTHKYNFTPSSFLENELKRNFNRYGVTFDPLSPTLMQISLSITFEPLGLLYWLLNRIRLHRY